MNIDTNWIIGDRIGKKENNMLIGKIIQANKKYHITLYIFDEIS